MPTTTDPTPLSAEEISALVALTKQADTVELKVSVPDSPSGYGSTITALEIDPLDAQMRQVFFFDTPDLLLNQNRVVVRARRSQGGLDDSVVKLRPVVPNEIPAALRKVPQFGVEVEALPGGYVCSASFKAKLGRADVRPVALGQRPLRKLFTKGQRAFFAERAPDGIELDDLSILGPLLVLKLRHAPTAFARRLAVEAWLYPDGTRIVELSTRCQPTETFQVATELKAFLTDRGIDITGEQQTKTATALKFFSKELRKP